MAGRARPRVQWARLDGRARAPPLARDAAPVTAPAFAGAHLVGPALAGDLPQAWR